MSSKTQLGFTLIEIIIALAILGIVLSIGVPSYGDYVKRSKVAEAVLLSEEARRALVAYHLKNKESFAGNSSSLDERNAEIGLNKRSDYATDVIQKMWVGGGGVSGATDTSGHIAILLETDLRVGLDGASYARLLSTVEYKDGEYIYICGNSDSVHGNHVDADYLPANCRN